MGDISRLVGSAAGRAEFYDGNGRAIPAVRHVNPDGSLGGWIPAGKVIPASVFVHRTAIVLPGANLKPNMVIGHGLVADGDEVTS